MILWDLESGKSIHLLNEKASTRGAALAAFMSPFGEVSNPFDSKKHIDSKKHTKSVWSVAYSPDGKTALTGSDDKTVILWDLQSGKRIQTLKGHTSGVTSVAYSPDGKTALTGSFDGTTRSWDLTTGKELAALYRFNAGEEWLVLTPDGYFDGSVNAADFLSYRISGTSELIPLERFRTHFEHPGLLAKLIAREKFRHRYDPALDLPPVVTLSPLTVNQQGELKVVATAKAMGIEPLTQLRLMIDGRPHPINQGLVKVTEAGARTTRGTWKAKLTPGRHEVKVLAYTRVVFGVSDAKEVSYLGGNSPQIPLPKLYVLAVGISDYPDKEIQDLDYAHLDAEAVAKSYKTHSKKLFSKIEVKVLTNKEATEDNILDELEWLRHSVTQKDYGVFFFGGHGKRDERGNVYFLPYDADPDRLTRTAIDGDILNKELTSTVGNLTVILDACHSGAVGNQEKTRSLSDDLLRDLTTEEKGITVMCSTTGAEEARESHKYKHGVFTQAFLEGMQGKAKLSPDGAVYFKHLDVYVSDRVKELTKGYQHPVTKIPRGGRDFPVAKPK